MKNPIQPIIKDAGGQARFKANKIVQELLDTHPRFYMNDIVRKNFSDDDRQQFAQLIGYSLSGYSELMRYVDDVAYSAAEYVAEGIDWRDAKIKALEAKGWKVGTPKEFLNLSAEEAHYIELKLLLSKNLQDTRRRKRLTQHQLARLMQSSQSRIAKMEAGDPSVSLDLLIRSLFVLGTSRKRLAKILTS